MKSNNKVVLLVLALLVIFSLVTRLFRIAEPKNYYFDEVYHVPTAVAYSQNNPEAYNPFAPPPKEGTAYDWLHPPLAKLIQAGFIKALGDNPLGWRLASVIFGTGIVLATFFLATVAFGPLAGLFAAAVISFENLTFVMSRITMNDVFITFFTVVAFTFLIKYIKTWSFKWFFLAIIFSGLAWSSKWTGLYTVFAVGSVGVLLSLIKRNFKFKIIIALVIAPIIYLASYGQFWLQGHTVRDFIDLHKQIWWYQNRHDLEHPYGTTPLFCVPKGINAAKTWCPWVLDIRPVYFSYEQYGDRAGYIYNLGNPLIFWSGIVAISYLIGKFFEEKKAEVFVVILGYFIFWLPWMFSPRILFLHHYLPSIPFLAAATGYAILQIYKTRFKFLAFAIILLFATVFFYFYPISSGYPIKPEAIEKFMWLSTWR